MTRAWFGLSSFSVSWIPSTVLATFCVLLNTVIVSLSGPPSAL